MVRRRNKPCNNPRCGVSSGLDGRLTFGSGELSDNGYWEFPCHPCELHHYRKSRLNLAGVGGTIRLIWSISERNGKAFKAKNSDYEANLQIKKEYGRIYFELVQLTGAPDFNVIGRWMTVKDEEPRIRSDQILI